ncbi:aspartic peptidase domain-containing protein [Gautieria morchelliformis]|nr:aspartic peptidase domain-containing protein [Gautieria morchelliformis]
MLSVLSLVLLLPAALALPSFADRARARSFIQVAAQRAAKLAGEPTPDAVVGVPVTNGAVEYTASVGVGSPATQYTLIVDTGSSNTWVGATKAYVKTATSTQTANKVAVQYGSGSFVFTDQVTLASGLVIKSQSIGVASRSTGFQGVDGILGIGALLFSQSSSDHLRRHDSTKFTGSISFTPITSTSPPVFWGIDQSVTYFGTSTNILSSTAGICRHRHNPRLLLRRLDRYQTATGAVLDNTTGLLRLTTTQFANLQSFSLTPPQTTFELTANAQAWPRSLNSSLAATQQCLPHCWRPRHPQWRGLDFINGFAFLCGRFYSVFDTTNQRVGLATTSFTDATTN